MRDFVLGVFCGTLATFAGKNYANGVEPLGFAYLVVALTVVIVREIKNV